MALPLSVAKDLLTRKQMSELSGSGKIALWYEDKINSWPEDTAIDRGVKAKTMKDYWSFMLAFNQGIGGVHEPILYYPQTATLGDWEDDAVKQQSDLQERSLAADKG